MESNNEKMEVAIMLANKFIDLQIIMAASCLAHERNLNDIKVESVTEQVRKEIYTEKVFSNFLPAYFWGALDYTLSLRGIQPGAECFAMITIGLFGLYGRDSGTRIARDLLDMMQENHPWFADTKAFRLGGATGMKSFLESCSILRSNNDSDMHNMFGVNSFANYLSSIHKDFLMTIIFKSANRVA